MKSKVATTTLIALALLCLAPAVRAQNHRCSKATLAGRWGYSVSGSLIGIGPVAATGIATYDGKGSLSGSQTRSVNGDVAAETYQGRYDVKADCSLIEVIQVFQSGQLVRTSTLQGVIDDNGNSGRGIFTNVELPDGSVLPSVLTFDGKRLFPRHDD